MRYRNRIKLAPGINLNLSGSGLSTTLGPRGASVNIGKNGAYLNTGIPGTGLYNRSKIAKSTSRAGLNTSINKSQVGVKLDLNDQYEPIIEIFDPRGINITSPTTINKIKRGAEYKENLKKIYKIYYDLIIEETIEFTELYKHIVKPISKKEIQHKLEDLKLRTYSEKGFHKSKPTEDVVKAQLSKEALIKFNSLLFWKNNKNRIHYVEENLENRLKESIDSWIFEKDTFEKNELLKEVGINEEYQLEYGTNWNSLTSNLNGSEDFVLKNFEAILSEIDIKPEFFIDFEYREEKKTFLIDLDLPEIEHIPKKTATILKSGKLSVKDKSAKQLREDYAQCVNGLGFLIGGIAFLSSSGIEKVIVSAYTQRVDKKDGQTKDDYIYSITFDSNNFSKLNFPKIDPVFAFSSFEHKMELSNSSVFKTITIN